jgi:hypothetical protein
MKNPAEIDAFCDRCKKYKDTCLVVPYRVPPRLTPPPTEPLIGPDYFSERVIIDMEDIRTPTAVICRDCRRLKEDFAAES